MGDEKSNVIDLDCVTLLDIPAEKMLEAAKDVNLKHIVIIGEYEDGEEYFASSTSDCPLVLWMLEQAKRALFEMAAEEDEYEDA